MPTPGEHKTVQARILEYAEAIGWTIVSREAAEKRRGGIPAPLRKKDGDGGDRNVPAPLSLFFDRVEGLSLKRKRRLRVTPKTAIRPRIPSPDNLIAQNQAPTK